MYTPALTSPTAHRPLPRASAAATPMAFVQAIVRAYALRGMDAAGVLRQAQIAPEEVANA